VVLFELYHGPLDTFITLIFRPRINMIGVESGPIKLQRTYKPKGA
jgi:hypothetical protein